MLTSALVVAACAPESGSSSAEPSPAFSPPLPAGISLDEVADQQAVDEALTPLWDLVEGDGARDSGYARAVVDVEHRGATILWKGTPPRPVRELAGVTETGVTIDVAEARYSQGDITDAARNLFDAARAGELPMPTGVGANDRFDGLVVSFDAPRLAEHGTASLVRDVESIAGIPTAVTMASLGAEAIVHG